ncbi:MAG: LD-carboxypeptidase [Candidatus Brocadiae bacterium]|nr:LD-carboxypeptidase [Candidatus Brocadiia bacterium]
MTPLLPPRLRPGATIAVISPASTPDPAALRRGIREIEKRGYRVRVGRFAGEKSDHLAGRDIDRLADLHDAFADPAVGAVFASRGGTGCTRLLDRVDYALIRRHPKIFVGYSDLTALQLALFARTELVSFSGPMVATNFDGGLPAFVERHFWPLLELPQPPQVVLGKPLTGAGRGAAVGRILGGTLSILQTVIGTPYAPSFDGAILVLEDVGEEVRRIDRTLAQLRHAGIWERIAGVVFATWSDCTPQPALLRTLRHYAGLLGGRPALFGLPYGHVDRTLTLPIGGMGRVDAGKGTFEILDGAVR